MPEAAQIERKGLMPPENPMPEPLAAEEPADEPLNKYLTITLSASMVRAIDNYFHERRFPTKSAAVRDLIGLGLRSAIWRSTRP